MADPPDSPTPRSQCLSSPPGESKLELMPTEVVEKIFEQLSLKNLQSLHDLEDEYLLQAYRSALMNMCSLCLTSKRVDAVARPLLFRNITVGSPAMLLQLYEALLANAQLGCYIRQISFEIIRDQVRLCDFLPARSPQSQSLLTGWDEDFGKYDPEAFYDSESFNNHCYDQILSSCYFEILRRTPKAHQLVIRMQPTSRRSYRGQTGLGGAMGIYMYQPFFRKVRHAVEASLTGYSEFLPVLTTLQLLGDPLDDENVFDISICEPLLRIQSLRKITTFRDNGFWSALKAETPGTANSGSSHNVVSLNVGLHFSTDRAVTNVRVAELQHSTFYSLDFGALGALLVNVEVLKISTPRKTDWMFSRTGRRVQEKNLDEGIDYLQEALAQMKNLRSLFLDFTYDFFREGLPTTKLPTLASLPKLETVSIPLQMLVDDRRRTRRNRIDRLVEVFPILLKRLTLKVDIPCQEYLSDSEDDHPDRFVATSPDNETLLDFVESLSHVGQDAFPYLREVVCSYKRMVHRDVFAPEEAEPLARDFEEVGLLGVEVDSYQRLEQLRVSLQQRKTRFSVAFESLECTGMDCRYTLEPYA